MWDLLIVLLLITELLRFSIEKSFQLEVTSSQYLITNDWFKIFLFTFDVLFSLNTLCYKDGMQITDRSLILRTYVKEKLLGDALALMATSFTLTVENFQDSVDLYPLFLLKLKNYNEFESRIKELLITSIRAESLYKIFGLVLKIFLSAHLLACLWHYIAVMVNLQDPLKRTWLKDKGIENESIAGKYLYSFYWGITTMLTVGYGDITPTNIPEVFFNIWAMLLGCGLFGYTMNYIGEVLSFANNRERHLK